MIHLPLVTSPKRLVALVVFVPFIASQIFWLWKLRSLKRRCCRNRVLRRGLDAAGAGIYFALLIYAFFAWRRTSGSTHLTLGAALLDAPIAWWLFGSTAGFAIYVIVRGLGFLAAFAAPFARRLRNARSGVPPGEDQEASADRGLPPRTFPIQPGRRLLFRRSAMALGAAPFVAGAYGILRGRIDLEVTNLRLGLPRLPRAFDGFRVLQLSDLHIGPFMTKREIDKIVEISNRLKPDLAVLTGDFVIWDPSTQFAVVDALSRLRAPYGVWGCLGNHEIYAHIEDSITRLFALSGIRILRQQQSPVFVQRDFINLIGVDFETRWTFGPSYRAPGYVRTYLEGVDRLMLPSAVNLLMSHNPDTFDRAAELGIDLTIAGHTHGGQIALELGRENLSPVRLLTAYVEGLFHKKSAQLYVNRGIGTIGLPIRLGAPPEITVYQLARHV
ncbi:MAG: metallophosphoesterase [Terriglobia bacterium]